MILPIRPQRRTKAWIAYWAKLTVKLKSRTAPLPTRKLAKLNLKKVRLKESPKNLNKLTLLKKMKTLSKCSGEGLKIGIKIKVRNLTSSEIAFFYAASQYGCVT